MNKARGEGQMEGITKMKNVGYDLWAGFRDGARRDVSSFSRAQAAVGCWLSATFSRMMMMMMMLSVYEDSLFFFFNLQWDER